jgi:hypothetical protein
MKLTVKIRYTEEKFLKLTVKIRDLEENDPLSKSWRRPCRELAANFVAPLTLPMPRML